MSRRADTPVLFDDLRGGMNGSDSPLSLSRDQCVDAVDVDWFDGTLARKRGGSSSLSMTFSAGGPFTGFISSIISHVPGADETARELWAIDANSLVGRLAGAATWTAPTVVDSPETATDIYGVSFADKLFLAYNSAQNRLHVWDGTRVRRVGLATPDPPTVATQGGAGLSFTRYYRIRTVDIVSSVVVRRSEASTSVSITITDDTGVTVTRPTLPTNEHETHWEVEYADASTGPWYRASQVATGTSTYSDTAATVSTTNLTDSAGIHFPPPSPKFLIKDQARLIMAHGWETSGGYTTPSTRRVWWTPPTGSRSTSSVDEAETIPLTTSVQVEYGLDVEEAITGLGGPVSGDSIVFSYRSMWGLTPTTLTGANAYRRYTIRRDIGCIKHQSIVNAEDENGNPCLYWLSHRGPYRIGPKGVQYVGNDIEHIWSTVNLAATGVVAHGLYHADKHQIWWWVATSSNNDPDTKIVFDTRLGVSNGDSVTKGWSRGTGAQATSRCSCLFSNTVGATMSRDLKPYIGQLGATNRIYKCDTGTDDAGTNFQAYVDTRPEQPGGYGFNHRVQDGELYAKAASGVTITITPLGSSGLESGQAGTCLLTASGSETRVIKRAEGLQLAGHAYIAFRIGDGSAASNAWTLDAYRPFMSVQEARG